MVGASVSLANSYKVFIEYDLVPVCGNKDSMMRCRVRDVDQRSYQEHTRNTRSR
jgi:hypothetical protein